MATIMVDMGDRGYDVLTGYTHEGWGSVFIYDPDDNTIGGGIDGPLNFIAIVE